MNSKRVILILFTFYFSAVFSGCGDSQFPSGSAETDHYPRIFPDYTDLTIPPNIAPLNFVIREAGEKYAVRIASVNGEDIIISGSHPVIRINGTSWKRLLSLNKGEALTIDISIKNGKKWTKYKAIQQRIAKEDIDSYLSYRLINSAYVLWFEMGLYQRNLENFDQSTIIQNKSIGGACVNCHSLARNDPGKFSFHIRARFPGTIIYNNGSLEKIDTKTDFTLASAAYGSWHPDGRHIAFSVNQINQNFYVFENHSNEISDKYSDLIVYDTESKIITTSPEVSTRSRENLPEWSADGKYLYFISANEAVNDSSRWITRYSLMRIPYDVETNSWGRADTVISASKTGKSITFPRTSPDGRFLVFCMTDFGYFTIHHKISDLYILDLKNGAYRNIEEINSSETESYHSWSANSRWLIFSSRRMDGVLTRTYIAYAGEDGKFGKPFVLPQENPDFYNNCLLNFNRPELMTGRITISPQRIRDAARKTPIPAVFDPNVNVDALSGASRIKKPVLR